VVLAAVEPVYRCLGQAGHGIVKAAVGDMGVDGGSSGRGVAQKLGGFWPGAIEGIFRKDDNIQKQKAQPRKRANWQMGESRIHGLWQGAAQRGFSVGPRSVIGAGPERTGVR
jgi:hypothetical protein